MATGDVFQVKISGTVPGDNWNMTQHFRHVAGSGTADAVNQAIATAFEAVWCLFIRTIQTDDVRWTAIRVQCVSQPAQPVYIKPVDLPGLVVGDMLPAQNALLFTKRALAGGRQNVGKTYVVGIPESLVNGDTVNVANADIITAAAGFATIMTTTEGDMEPVIWHADAQTSEPITSCAARALISRQGRRRYKL